LEFDGAKGGEMVQRYPIKAIKDPKALGRISVSGERPWTALLKTLSSDEAEAFIAIARTLCPHEWAPPTSYQAVALSFDQTATGDRDVQALLRQALQRLDSIFDINFCNLSTGNRVICLRACEREPFFSYILQQTLRTFYDDPDIWAGCGYEGVLGTSDSETRAGYNDLSWLPEPIIDRD
jgi:hypothetical protein